MRHVHLHTHLSVSPWVTQRWRPRPARGRHSHTYICAHGAPATMQTQKPGPKTPTTPTPLYSFSLYSFFSISFFSFDARYSSYVRWHAYTYMCVKCIWSKQKYKRQREDRWFQGKKKTISWGWRGGGEYEGLKETGPFTPSPTYSQRASRLPCVSHFFHQNCTSMFHPLLLMEVRVLIVILCTKYKQVNKGFVSRY